VLGFYSDREGHPFREFSNFFRQRRAFDFRVPAFAQRDGFPPVVSCDFSEKAIMATKASLMQDLEAFRAIDAATNPKSCKKLGRRVRNFDEALWVAHLEEVAFEIVRQKFESDRELRELLLSTGDRILAEAAPYDCVWGIGLPLGDARVLDPSGWRGRNVLGHALMRARGHLRGGGGRAAEDDGEDDPRREPAAGRELAGGAAHAAEPAAPGADVAE